jgi:hypothetical protein
MANEILTEFLTGETLYALVFNAVGQIYNTALAAFETPGSANWADYDVAMVESATNTQIYRGSMPAVAAGSYWISIRWEAGDSPDVGDFTVDGKAIEWSGSAVVALSGRAAPGDAMDLVTDALDAAALKADAVAEIQSGLSTLTQAQILSDATPFAGANVAAIKAKTDNLPSNPAAVGSAMTLADDAITAAKIAADAIGASELAADAVAEIQSGLSTLTQAQILSDATPFAGANVAAIKAKTDNLPSNPAAVGSAMTLADDAITAAKIAADAIGASELAADAVDEILDEIIEGTVTLRQALRIVLAFIAGKASGGGTTTVTFKDIGDTKSRIVMTVDTEGNRTGVVIDGG